MSDDKPRIGTEEAAMDCARRLTAVDGKTRYVYFDGGFVVATEPPVASGPSDYIEVRPAP
jgi:hypothetical protein